MSGVLLGPIDVLAVHDPCLARMQFEIAGPKPLPDAVKHVFRLASALAVKHGVVGVPGEPDAGQMPRHPEIERVVQEQVGQDRRHNSPNAKGNFCFDRVMPLDHCQVVLDFRLKR